MNPIAAIIAVLAVATQCMTYVDDNNEMQKHCYPASAWVLDYHCDAGKPYCSTEQDNHSYRQKSFSTKSEAISWVERNFEFAPSRLWHRGKSYTCVSQYLDRDNEDSYARFQKKVTCGSVKDLEGVEFGDAAIAFPYP